MTARITVSRAKGWQDRVRSYRIELDGADVGKLKAGRTLELEVPPGRHILQARISSTGSPPYEVVAAEGAAVALRVVPAEGDALTRAKSGEDWLAIEPA